MIVAKVVCPRDGAFGQLSFYTCSSRNLLFLMCDECMSLWIDRKNVDYEHYIDYPDPPDYFVKELGCSLLGSRLATKEEVLGSDWADFFEKEI